MMETDMFEKDELPNKKKPSETKGLIICRELHPFICFLPDSAAGLPEYVRQFQDKLAVHHWVKYEDVVSANSPFVRQKAFTR